MFPSIMLALWQFPVLKNSKQINEVTKRNLLIRIITLLCITQLIVFMTSKPVEKECFKKNIYIYILFLAVVFIAAQAFSSCGDRRLLSSSEA